MPQRLVAHYYDTIAGKTSKVVSKEYSMLALTII
jgi:hypothetical protein